MNIQKTLLTTISSLVIASTIASCNKPSQSFEPFEVKESASKNYFITGVNQLENSDFSQGEDHWGLYCQSGGNASFSVANKQAIITINGSGSTNYANQFYYDGLRAYQNGKYIFTFTASSSVQQPCEVRLQVNGGDYHAYAMDTFTFGPEEKQYSLSFTMKEESDMSPRMAFNLGYFSNFDLPKERTQRHTVTIKNCSYVLTNEIAEKTEGNGGADFVRLNQIGFKPSDTKTAYVKVENDGGSFQILNESKNVVYEGKLQNAIRDEQAQEYTAKAIFTNFTTPGTYTIKSNGNESFPFTISQSPYKNILTSALRYYYLARCGTPITDSVFSHPECHTLIANTVDYTVKKDVTGGWHDAGDYGRYVVPAAKAVFDLLTAAPKIAQSDVNFNVYDEVKWELDWMLKMQDDNGGVYHKATCSSFNGFEMPELETNRIFLSSISTCATADFAATCAYASMCYKNIDSAYSQTLLNAAEKAWSYLESNRFRAFKNQDFITTGEYSDISDIDERYLAAVCLALATRNSKYTQKAQEYILTNEAKEWNQRFGWEQMEGYAAMVILRNQKDFPQALVNFSKKGIAKAADVVYMNTQKSGFNQAQPDLNWGSNMEAMNLSLLLQLQWEQTNNAKYLQAAKAQVDYVLGANPLSICYVTGFGSNSPEHPHHRPSISKNYCQPGMLVGGPDPKLEDEIAQNLLSDKPDLMCYIDNYQSYSTNEITIYWNSPFILAVAQLYL